MEQLLELLKSIYIIRFYSKDIHYNCSGLSAYSDHLLADRVFDGLDGFIDQINETIYMGYGHIPPSSREVLNGVVSDVPSIVDDITKCWGFLYEKIESCLDLISDIRDRFEDPALSSLLDGLAEDLRVKKGLVWRRIV